MPKAFDFSSPPFDRLRPMEVERVNHVVDVVFFRTGQTVLDRGRAAGSLLHRHQGPGGGAGRRRGRGRARERRRRSTARSWCTRRRATTSSCARRRSATRCRSRTSSSSPPTTRPSPPSSSWTSRTSWRHWASGRRARRRPARSPCGSARRALLPPVFVAARDHPARGGRAHGRGGPARPAGRATATASASSPASTSPGRPWRSASRWRRRCATWSHWGVHGDRTRTASCSRRPC